MTSDQRHLLCAKNTAQFSELTLASTIYLFSVCEPNLFIRVEIRKTFYDCLTIVLWLSGTITEKEL
jgi:hypothetical protein